MEPTSAGPAWLRKWGWRSWWAVGIGVAAILAFRAFTSVKLVGIPLLLSVFPAAILWPLRTRLRRRGLGRGVAALAALVPAVLVAAGTLWVVSSGLSEGFSDLASEIGDFAQEARVWLIEGPLGLSAEQIDRYWEDATAGGSDALINGLGTGLEVAAGALLTVVLTFFVLKDGDRLLEAAGRPWGRARQFVENGKTIRKTLARYLGGLAVIGVPFVFPLSVLIFWGAFFPIIGAWATGLVGVVVALVNGGIGDAVWTLILITAVQQIEGDVIMPVVVGDVTSLHPMVVLVGVIGGGAAFGVAGAFLTVPVLAVISQVAEASRGDPLLDI